MQEYLIPGRILYRIFDKSYTNSTGIYCKYKAKDESSLLDIKNNLSHMKLELQVDNILILRQFHSNKIVDADEITNFEDQPQADGAVTSKNKIALTIQTADCVPVLLASSCGNIIGAAHCGWRGSKANIIAKVTEQMINKGAKNIKAFIGPSIKQESYEVDQDYYQDFLKDDKKYKDFFVSSANPNHYMFDLPGFLESKLHDANIDDIIISKDNTYLMPHKYPSYRYFMHHNLPYRENILSTISIL